MSPGKGRPCESTIWTDIVIFLTRLGNGIQMAVNPDLIERAEHTPDTVITLIDGHKLVVQEPLDEVVALIRAWRASVAGEAIALARLSLENPHTSRLPGAEAHRVPLQPGPVSEDEAATALLADSAASGPTLGQVLHLPTREA